MNLDEMGPYIDKNTVSLCVRFEVLEVHADLPEPTIGPDPASHPFARLVNNPMFSDITFRVVEDPSSPTSPSPNTATTLSPSETIVHAHKSILAASSSWFEALFTNGMRETYESEITLESVDHVVFLQLLRYCYTLQIPQIRSRREAERLLALADRFEVIPVREECLRFLRIELALNNVWSTWATADKYTSERTSTVCRQFAAAHLGELLDHPSTMNAKPQVLRMALEADEANVSGEEKIYETIVRWARYYDSAASPRGGDLDARQVDRDRDPATAFDTPSIDFGISAPPAALSSYASSELDWDVTSSEPLLRSESPTNTTAPTTSASTTVDDDMEVSSPTALSPHPGNVTLSVVHTIASSSIVLPTSPAPTLAHPPNHRRHTISSTKSPARSGTAPAPAAVTGAAPSRSPYYYRAFGHSTRHYFLPSLLACVKFPLMEKKFLVDVVERDEMVMQADGMKDLLIEAYRHHLLPEASSSISQRIKPRRKFKPAE
ncbi:hypothetical protein BC938DRAFT_475470 [Jimgerdemannia flammicorona]|uniref:BTB domain-containing protein n=1 Tax=Jimgerdemannia flammicorona TaxID=994334 RepID=A0A433PU39_9FUNG|nr:hypothetical protein BC938DRAFT_475470 [Jimgerdemannia flammicorona]